MIRSRALIGVLGILLFSTTSPAAVAQSRPSAAQRDTMEIELVAAQQARLWRHIDSAVFVSGKSHLLPNAKADLSRDANRSDALAKALQNQLAADSVHEVCDSRDLRTCRIVGAAALVAVGAPRIVGDTAIVEVSWRMNTPGHDQGVSSLGITILIYRTRDVWTFLRYGQTRAS